MKKIITISILILLLFTGCTSIKTGTLDTSKLQKIEMKDVSTDQKKKMPITYQAPSVKVGLDAIPFNIKLPIKLPFDAAQFQPPIINDMAHDGKKLMVEFKCFSQKRSKKIILIINVINEDLKNNDTNAEKIELKNHITSDYFNNSISFNENGISYTITYINKYISKEQHKKEITVIANQMI